MDGVPHPPGRHHQRTHVVFHWEDTYQVKTHRVVVTKATSLAWVIW